MHSDELHNLKIWDLQSGEDRIHGFLGCCAMLVQWLDTIISEDHTASTCLDNSE